MTRKTHDLTIPAGTYTDRNGNEKTTWQNIGAVFQSDNGKSFLTLRRTFAPAGIPVDPNGNNRDSVIINMFSAEDRNQRGY